VKIPASAAVSHNLIHMHHGDDAWPDNQPDNIPHAHLLTFPMEIVTTTMMRPLLEVKLKMGML
jgi:hypothetical protein